MRKGTEVRNIFFACVGPSTIGPSKHSLKYSPEGTQTQPGVGGLVTYEHLWEWPHEPSEYCLGAPSPT